MNAWEIEPQYRLVIAIISLQFASSLLFLLVISIFVSPITAIRDTVKDC